MVWLWQRMVEMYGATWTSSFGDVPIKTWANALSTFDNESIKTGLTFCLHRKDRNGRSNIFPPNLPEFISLCRSVVTPMSHRTYVALPKPPLNKSLVKLNLVKIRESIGYG